MIATRFSTQLGEAMSLTPSATDPDQPRLHTFDVIVETAGDIIESVIGSFSIPLARITIGLIALTVFVLAFMTFRRWMIWRKSRLIINESGLSLVEGDIVWLVAPGHVRNLNADIVNSASKSRDALGQFVFWGCWTVSILSYEQTGNDDKVQVWVRDPDRVVATIRAIKALNKLTKNPEQREANRLLAKVIENLEALRLLEESRKREDV
jgi:hypothetical protein